MLVNATMHHVHAYSGARLQLHSFLVRHNSLLLFNAY